jgi:hypothetical protein
MGDYGKPVRDILKSHGCKFVRHGRGDHDIWHSPIKNSNFPVDAVIKSRHTANAVMKQSGIEHRFR